MNTQPVQMTQQDFQTLMNRLESLQQQVTAATALNSERDRIQAEHQAALAAKDAELAQLRDQLLRHAVNQPLPDDDEELEEMDPEHVPPAIPENPAPVDGTAEPPAVAVPPAVVPPPPPVVQLPRLNPPAPTPFTGDGQQEIQTWLQEIEAYFAMCGYNVGNQVSYILPFLGNGPKSQWLMECRRLREEIQKEPTWTDFVVRMGALYGAVDKARKAADKLDRLKQTTSVEAYAREFLRLEGLLDKDWKFSAERRIQKFVDGLKPDLRVAMAGVTSWASFEAMMTHANTLDTNLMRIKRDESGKGIANEGNQKKRQWPFSQGGGKRRDQPSSSEQKLPDT